MLATKLSKLTANIRVDDVGEVLWHFAHIHPYKVILFVDSTENIVICVPQRNRFGVQMTYQSSTGLSLAAAIQINKPVMLDLALNEIFKDEINLAYHKFTCVEDRHIGVVRALFCCLMFDEKVNAETLNIRVQIQNGVGESTARKHTYEAEEMKLIVSTQARHNNQETVYRMAPGVQGKLADFGALELEIANVIQEQLKNPMDPYAGNGLVPAGMYFNCTAPEVRELAREEMAKRVKAKADKKNKRETEQYK